MQLVQSKRLSISSDDLCQRARDLIDDKKFFVHVDGEAEAKFFPAHVDEDHEPLVHDEPAPAVRPLPAAEVPAAPPKPLPAAAAHAPPPIAPSVAARNITTKEKSNTIRSALGDVSNVVEGLLAMASALPPFAGHDEIVVPDADAKPAPKPWPWPWPWP